MSEHNYERAIGRVFALEIGGGVEIGGSSRI